MASYTGKIAVHETLTETVADTITLTGFGNSVTVVNRGGANEIYFTVGYVNSPPTAAVATANDNFVLPEAVCSLTVDAQSGGGNVIVSINSAGNAEYSVELLP